MPVAPDGLPQRLQRQSADHHLFGNRAREHPQGRARSEKLRGNEARPHFAKAIDAEQVIAETNKDAGLKAGFNALNNLNYAMIRVKATEMLSEMR